MQLLNFISLIFLKEEKCFRLNNSFIIGFCKLVLIQSNWDLSKMDDQLQKIWRLHNWFEEDFAFPQTKALRKESTQRMVESNYYSFKMNLKILERKIRIINEANLACRKLSLTRSRSTPAFDLESFPYLKVPEISHVLIKDYLVDMLPKKIHSIKS